jgi:hypothetical protein
MAFVDSLTKVPLRAEGGGKQRLAAVAARQTPKNDNYYYRYQR